MAQEKSSSIGQAVMNKMSWVQRFVTVLIHAMLIVSCTSQRPAAPAPLSTRKPANTSTAVPQRGTTAPEVIDIQGGRFTLAIRPGLTVETRDDSISISDQRGELVVSLNGRPYVASSYTLQSFLGKYLTEMSSRGGSFDQGEPYDIVIDGRSGIAIDFSGSFLDNPINGKAVAVSPEEDFIIFGLGMSLLTGHENGWTESGSLIFESILDSIDLKEKVK